jgi:hypothetical protein
MAWTAWFSSSSQDAWVEVKDKSGKIVFSQLGKAGSPGSPGEARAPMSLVVGNARYVKLERNGSPVDLRASTKVPVARHQAGMNSTKLWIFLFPGVQPPAASVAKCVIGHVADRFRRLRWSSSR